MIAPVTVDERGSGEANDHRQLVSEAFGNADSIPEGFDGPIGITEKSLDSREVVPAAGASIVAAVEKGLGSVLCRVGERQSALHVRKGGGRLSHREACGPERASGPNSEARRSASDPFVATCPS